MDCTSLRRVAAVADGGHDADAVQDAPGLPDAIDVLNMHDEEDCDKTSDENVTERSFDKKDPVGSFFAIVSFRSISAVLYPLLSRH
jgi:hypothetical protein